MLEIIQKDATEVQENIKTMLVHIVNNQGIWGAGFVLALEKKYPQAKRSYLQDKNRILGSVNYVKINPNLKIANMVAQSGVISHDNPHPLNYQALNQCLEEVYLQAKKEKAVIQMPKIGSGLAGGDWPRILSMIQKHAQEKEVFTQICVI